MDQEEMRGRVAELARALGTDVPAVALGPVPEWAPGALLRTGGDRAPLARPGSMTLTVDPRLAALPRAVQDGILAHPLAGLALDQPRRRRRRTRVITALGLAASVAGALLDRPFMWAGAVAATCVLIAVTDMIGLRRFAYEADRRAADALGAETMEMALDHLRTNPPQFRGWMRPLAAALPAPARRAARLHPTAR